MDTISLFEFLLRREDFREYIREVFFELNKQFNITLDELLAWLNTKKSVGNWGSDLQTHIKAGVYDQVELYKFVFPCNVERFRGEFSFDILPYDDGDLVYIHKYKSLHTDVYIRSFRYDDLYSFKVYQLSKCFADNYDLTVSLLRGVLNEGGTK